MQINREKLKNARVAKNLSQADIAHYLDISQPHVGGMEKGRVKTFNSINQVLKLAEYLEVQPAELIIDEDAYFFKEILLSSKIKLISLPLLDVRDILAYVDNNVLPPNARSIQMSANNIQISEKGFSIMIEGDAMISNQAPSESFYPGEVAIIDPERPHKSGDVVLAQTEEAGIKLRQFVKDGSESFLKAFNSSYEKTFVNEKTRVLGVVVLTQKTRSN